MEGQTCVSHTIGMHLSTGMKLADVCLKCASFKSVRLTSRKRPSLDFSSCGSLTFISVQAVAPYIFLLTSLLWAKYGNLLHYLCTTGTSYNMPEYDGEYQNVVFGLGSSTEGLPLCFAENTEQLCVDTRACGVVVIWEENDGEGCDVDTAYDGSWGMGVDRGTGV